METVLEYQVENLKEQSEEKIISIGGHYNFPNKPTEFALKSILLANKMINNNDDKLFSFINDLRADNLCNYGVCELPTNKLSQSHTTKSLKTIDDLFSFPNELDALENHFTINIKQEFTSKLKLLLSGHKIPADKIVDFVLSNYKDNFSITEQKSGKKLSLVYNLVQSCFDFQKTKSIENIYWTIDNLLYEIDKENFHPLQFTKLGLTSKTLFEKSIYNYSSKIIRKLHKRGKLPELTVTKDAEKSFYTCKDFNGGDILLRKETMIGENFNAINKCPLIIATLYYKIINETKHDQINLIYMIPSYDRSKVNLGTECFFNMYFPYLQKATGIKKLTIHNIYWTSENGDILICDKYQPKYKETTICKNNLN